MQCLKRLIQNECNDYIHNPLSQTVLRLKDSSFDYMLHKLMITYLAFISLKPRFPSWIMNGTKRNDSRAFRIECMCEKTRLILSLLNSFLSLFEIYISLVYCVCMLRFWVQDTCDITY